MISSTKFNRDVCFDTETTGFAHSGSDRVIEIAAVELRDFIPTGRKFHVLIDPERDVPPEAVKVHGITRDMLRGKPRFYAVAREFLEFIEGARLIAHNALFDIEFINAELRRLSEPELTNPYVDTVSKAKQLFGGNNMTLDSLCRRFNIDTSERVKHGAMIDTELLAQVWLHMNGGRARTLNFESEKVSPVHRGEIKSYPPRDLGFASEEERQIHLQYVGKSIKNSKWNIEGSSFKI